MCTCTCNRIPSLFQSVPKQVPIADHKQDPGGNLFSEILITRTQSTIATNLAMLLAILPLSIRVQTMINHIQFDKTYVIVKYDPEMSYLLL